MARQARILALSVRCDGCRRGVPHSAHLSSWITQKEPSPLHSRPVQRPQSGLWRLNTVTMTDSGPCPRGPLVARQPVGLPLGQLPLGRQPRDDPQILGRAFDRVR